jgi:hypothetical protein
VSVTDASGRTAGDAIDLVAAVDDAVAPVPSGAAATDPVTVVP